MGKSVPSLARKMRSPVLSWLTIAVIIYPAVIIDPTYLSITFSRLSTTHCTTHGGTDQGAIALRSDVVVFTHCLASLGHSAWLGLHC
ncbi:MAG: hypothetical protein VKK04_18425 [Synechococcales bacterium]|nr:hypothetical protein [Synechococcales bacterium]